MRPKGRRQKREDVEREVQNDALAAHGAREALRCAVEAVAVAVEEQVGDVDALYAEMRWRLPLERAMEATNAHSMSVRRSIGQVAAPAEVEIAELARLISSVDTDTHLHTRERLEKQKERKEKDAVRTECKEACPTQLQVGVKTPEDPLEARRDSCGRAVQLGRNVMGDHYASRSSPLSYTRGKTAAEIFARMRHVIREDLRLRDVRRIAALNEQERARKQQLQNLGYLSSEAVIEARFDYLLRRESTDPAL